MVIPRQYLQLEMDQLLTLHVFVDPTMKAYGSSIYVCQGTLSSFVMAKARVALLKQHTLPKLELMAAVNGARLCQFVLKSLDQFHPRVFMWSDSQIALHWLLNSKKLQSCVAKCTQEIHSLVPQDTQNYCPTQDNPADLVARGVSVPTLKESSLWQHGPT